MSAAERFFDTNVLLYLLSGDAARADRAESELAAGGIISVQVLNEFAAVARRKLGMPFTEISEVLAAVRSVCSVVPLDELTHDRGLHIAQRYQLALYDAMIVAAAVISGCRTLVTEDLQHGQRFDGCVTVRNPFR